MRHNSMSIMDVSNKEIVESYLDLYRHSKQSVKARKSALRYFFDNGSRFGYDGHIGEINKRVLIDYFKWLNHLERLALSTKEFKWAILKSLIQFAMEYYDDFVIVIPEHTVQWAPKKAHKEAKSNKDTVLTKNEVLQILHWLKLHHYRHYIEIRMLAETGMRVNSLVNSTLENIDLDKRYIKVGGKRRREVYYFSKDLKKHLKVHVEQQRREGMIYLFPSTHSKRVSKRTILNWIKKASSDLEKNVSTHTFRRTINTLRKKMGCSGENRSILLNHRVRSVNLSNYVKLSYSDFIKLYDTYNPYKDLKL